MLDGGRINPLCLVPEFLLRRHAAEGGLSPSRMVLITADVANPVLWEMWKERFSAIKVGARLFGWLQVAFPEQTHADVAERIHPRQFQDLFQTHTEPQLRLPDSVVQAGQAYLRSLGFAEDDWFVGFVNRDEAYLGQTQQRRDWSYHDYRNSKIGNYVSAMQTVVDAGGWAIRMGYHVEEPLPANRDPRIVDYASEHRTPALDLFLLSRCRFFVVGNTGLSGIASAFGRPCAFTNLIPLTFVDPFLRQDLYIPKLLKDAGGQLIDFDAMRDLGLFDPSAGAWQSGFYEDAGVRPVENSAGEIDDLVREMLNRTDSSPWSTVQTLFKKRYYSDHAENWSTKPDISSEFLSRHRDLLAADFPVPAPSARAGQAD